LLSPIVYLIFYVFDYIFFLFYFVNNYKYLRDNTSTDEAWPQRYNETIKEIVHLKIDILTRISF